MRVAVVLLIILVAPLTLRAEDVPQPVPAAEGKCSTPADEHWKAQEQFVWRRVCLGDEANFNIEPGYGGDLDPKEPAGLPESRILRSTFLATILLSDGYRHAVTSRGVRIVGARFTENVDLQNAELSSDLWLDRSLFEQGANFRGLRSTRRITLYGSKVTGPLRMAGLEIRGDLSMGGKAEFTAVDLAAAHVGGYLVLTGSTVGENLNMVGLQVGKNVFMDDKAQFAQVDLTSARVGWLSLANSRVTGELDMAELHVDGDLLMYQSKFADVLLGLAQVHGNLILANTEVTDNLVMFGLHVDGDLVGLKAEVAKVSLASAEVHGALSLIGATVAGDLDMSGLRVGRDLLLNSMSMNSVVATTPELLKGSLDALGVKVEGDAPSILKAKFGNVSLAGAVVKGGLSLIGATVSGKLGMDGAQIGADLTMVDGEYQAVNLERARIAGVFNLRGSKLAGQLDCIASEIGSRFDLSGGAEFAGPVNCNFAKVGELDLGGGSFQDNVDLTGIQISGELRIGSAGDERARWAETSTLYLSNARAEAIQDSQDAWPNRIDLSGFTYRNLGGHQATRQDLMADRPVNWFVNWLGRQRPYAPAPYEQLATVLRNQGRPGDADEILYAGRERERVQALLPRRAWLTIINLLIGYGYHMERALVWVAGFLVTGIAVLRFSGQGPRNLMPFGIAYSFDMLLPIIRLRERHYQIDLQGWPRYYFYVHKIMGYVLASFLIAGLAGIGK
jgi:hypothetical protein